MRPSPYSHVLLRVLPAALVFATAPSPGHSDPGAQSTRLKVLDSREFTWLAGKWEVQKGVSTCRNLVFDVAADPRTVVERRECGLGVVRLSYESEGYCSKGRRLLTATPLGGADSPRAIVLESGSTSYNADRLTLWLSKDGCWLTGARSDRNAAVAFSARRAECPAPPPPCR